MSRPQIGIFSLGDAAHSLMEFTLLRSTPAARAVTTVAALHDPRSTVEGVNLVVGFRPELWRVVEPGDAPANSTSFLRDIVGPTGYIMPATQADLFFWIAGASYDVVFDVATAVVDSLKALATPEREFTGWSYQRNRDLTGFEDGTKNPNLIEAPDVALIDEGEPGASGSMLLFQQWKHDTAAWRALTTEAQEHVIGRTKAHSIEYEESRMPPDSHVSRTTLQENGVELPIFRRNVAYGNVSDHGTLFIGFSKEQLRLQRMLERMAGIGDGICDALTRFTQPLTGAYYFVPALSTLSRLSPSA